ncbi:MAG: DUF177 domain-containing protein [Myxococcales bacterium]|nr:DUF177 domain-containing protein [Polyangiaceae bacterium]MDW8251788.1 DUF177 domain-containing protein [Myxococcales bacterium]
MAKFLLDLQDLDAAGKHLREAIPPTWLRGALEGCGIAPAGEEGLVDVHYSRSGTDLILRGKVKATVEVSCARCTVPVHVLLEAELSLMLVPASDPRGDFARGRRGGSKGGEYEFSGAEADMDVYEGDEVALDPFVREALLLEVPPFPLCSEDCRGIAPPPQEERSKIEVDPRLAPLLKLKKQGN